MTYLDILVFHNVSAFDTKHAGRCVKVNCFHVDCQHCPHLVATGTACGGLRLNFPGREHNEAYHLGGQYWDYFPGILPLSQVTVTHLKIGYQ